MAKPITSGITCGSPGNGTTIHLAGEIFNTAVTSARRSTSMPDVPTVAGSGYKDFDVSTWYGLFLPAGTPKEIVATVNAEVNKLLATPAIRAVFSAAQDRLPEMEGHCAGPGSHHRVRRDLP